MYCMYLTRYHVCHAVSRISRGITYLTWLRISRAITYLTRYHVCLSHTVSRSSRGISRTYLKLYPVSHAVSRTYLAVSRISRIELHGWSRCAPCMFCTFRQTFCWNQSTSCCPSFAWCATHLCQNDVFPGSQKASIITPILKEIEFGSRWCQELSADFKLDIHFKSHRTNRCRTVKKTSRRFRFDATAPGRHIDQGTRPRQRWLRSSLTSSTAADGSASNLARLARHECRFRHRRPRHPPASIGDVVWYTGVGTSVAHLLSDRKDPGCVLRWPDVSTMPTIVWCAAGFSPRTSPFCSLYRRMSSELPWDVEYESTYMPTTPRSTSVAPPRDRQPAATRLLACVSEIESWMSSNRLKLNASKTEFIWIGTRRQLSKVEEEALMVGGQSITPMVKVRDLGVFIDRELTMEAHVSNTVRGCMYQLRQLRSVKRSLTLDSRRALATAFVASRIDYCNGVLYGVAKGEVQRL